MNFGESLIMKSIHLFPLSLLAMSLLSANVHAASTDPDKAFFNTKTSTKSVAPSATAAPTTDTNELAFFNGQTKEKQMVQSVSTASSIYNLITAQTGDGATELKVYFNGFPPQPKATKLSNPDRLLLDFGKVEFSKKKGGVTPTTEITGVEVIKSQEGNTILAITLGPHGSFTTRNDGGAFVLKVYQDPAKPVIVNNIVNQGGVSKVSYTRTKGGEDQAIIDLSSADTSVAVKQEGNKVVLKFAGNPLPNSMVQNKSFNDVKAVINGVRAYNEGKNGVIEISSNSSYEYTAIQVDKRLTVNFAKKNVVIQGKGKDSDVKKYTGRKITMDFQNVETRRILQLLASYTGVNIVASDNISGNISLKLENVPWDQALNIILKSKGLAQRQDGAVIWVAPLEEMTKYEESEARSYAQSITLAPLKTEFIQLNFAVASDVAALIKPSSVNTNANNRTTDVNRQLMLSRMDANGEDSGSLLSPRGTVTIDARTNTLIINDTVSKIAEIKKVITQIDIPVRQVMVEARIVHASTDFAKALGVRWGVSKSNGVSMAGNMTNLNKLYNTKWRGEDETLDENVNIDLGGSVAALGTSGITFGLINTANTLLSLELSALQSDGLGEVLSAPKVLTGDKQLAVIRSGTKIPYQTTSGNFGTTTTFQDAVLELNVTPSITPDGSVQMKLEISKDTLGTLTDAGYVIDTNQLTTNVLVGDGETVVLGGLYEDSRLNSVSKVPLLGDIPIMGALFRSKGSESRKQELLIFITPKIVAD